MASRWRRGLIGDKGDDYNTLQNYLTAIYGDKSAISQSNWEDFNNHICEYQNQSGSQDVEGMRLNSTDGVFDNLVGKYLMTMYRTNPEWRLGPFADNNCSPTTFNRVAFATEFVYGKNLLGDITWKNNNYKAWQGAQVEGLNKFGTGVVVSLQLGIDVYNVQSDLQPGALLGLASKSAWHSAFFVGYIYDGNNKIGFIYWDQNNPYTHECLFENGTYNIRKGVNFR